MTKVAVIQFVGAFAGLVALGAAMFPRRPVSQWQPRGLVILLAAVLTSTHLLSGFEHLDLGELDHLDDFARLTSPMLWFFLLYTWMHSDAARRLTESEERFRLFMDHSPTEAFIKDEEGRYVFGNRKWQERFGRPIDELLGKTDVDLWPKPTARLFRESDDLTRTQGRSVHQMEAGTGHDGRPRWFEVFKFPITDRDGRKLVAGIVHDITDRHHADQALRTSEQRYRDIVEDQTEFITRCAPDGTLTFVNSAYTRYHGKSVDEMIGKSFLPHVVEKDRALILAKFARLTPDHPVETDEHRVLLPDGRLVWHSWSDRGVFDEQGRLREIQSVGLDITDRVKAVQALRASEKKYRTIVESTDDGIWVIDADRRTTFVNRRMAEMLGVTVEEMLAKTFLDFTFPEDLPQDEGAVGRRPWDMAQRHDFRFRRKDGSAFWVLATTNPLLDEEGTQRGAIAVITDITARKDAERERRKLEMELSHKQKMEVVGNLASGIAHDFGNVLTAIQGHLSLAHRGLPPEHPAHKSLRMVGQAAQQGMDMAKSITSFALKTPVSKEPFALSELTADSLRLFRHLLPQSIELDYHRPSGAEPWVMAAPSQIQQVVMNLILNARDAMPAGGRISVRIRTMSRTQAQSIPHISPAPPDDPDSAKTDDGGTLPPQERVAVLSVTDTGCGMNEQVMARIFEPFFTTKDRQHGTGLGLATVHGIVSTHEGWVAVESMPDHGSRFEVFLPMCAPPPANPVAAASPANIPAHRPRFILVLHQNDFVGEIMTTSLESAGYVVVFAINPDDLLTLVAEHGGEVGAVIVDADLLPESEAPAIFSLQAQVGAIPMVVITSNMARFIDEPLAENFVSLPKPFQMSKLISLVDRAAGVIPPGAQ